MRRVLTAMTMGVVAAWTASTVFAQPVTSPATRTPIEHVVVIFPENRPFDHYFGTYPNALNLPGEPPFAPKGNTPAVDGFTWQLLNSNLNKVQPFRLSPGDV